MSVTCHGKDAGQIYTGSLGNGMWASGDIDRVRAGDAFEHEIEFSRGSQDNKLYDCIQDVD